MTANFMILMLCDRVGLDSPLSPQATVSTRNEARARGMLNVNGDVTEKGRVYIEALQAVPEPVASWRIP